MNLMQLRDVLCSEAEIGRILIKAIDAPWNIAVNTIKPKRPMASISQANAQMRCPENEELCWCRAYLAECIVYIPRASALLLYDSPLIQAKLAEDSTIAHSRGFDATLDSTTVSLYLDMLSSGTYGAYELDPRNVRVPPRSMHREENFDRLLGDVAYYYGEYLHDRGIAEVSFLCHDKNYIDAQEKPFAVQLTMGTDGDNKLLIDGVSKTFHQRVRTRALFKGD